MKALILFGLLAGAAGGDRIEEIKWFSAAQGFEKAKGEKSPRWVLIYKEWPG